MADIKGCFEPLTLTASLRPEPIPGEVEVCFANHVRVYYRDELTHENGSCHLTSHRIAWLSNKRKQGSKVPVHMFALPLKRVRSYSPKKKLFSSPKIVLQLLPTTPLQPGVEPPFIMLSFRDGNRDKFYEQLNIAYQNRAWYKQDKSTKKTGGEFTRVVGIKGLMQQEKKRMKEAEKEVNEAFSDLNALMSNAEKMVKLAKRCSDGMAARDNNEEQDQFVKMLGEMGIPSPVTRELAGTKYHEQLARQLADFMAHRLTAMGGMITLPDAFCLFNRARCTEMVSPDDMLNACRMFDELGLPVTFRKFPSQVMVIQAKSHSDAKMAQRIARHIEKNGAVSAIEISEDLRMSLVLAQQHLESAEQVGVLCRDQSEDGLFFYVNMFLSEENDGR